MLMNEKIKTNKIIAQELNNDITIMEGNFRGYLRKPKKSKPSFSKSQLKNVKEELEKVAESLDMSSSPKTSPKTNIHENNDENDEMETFFDDNSISGPQGHENKLDLITNNNVENKIGEWQLEKILQMQEQIQDKMNTFQLEINEIKTRLDQLVLEPLMNVPKISLTPPKESNEQCIQISENIGTTEM